MEYQDDRTEDQRKSHQWIVAGTDSFLSGWGKAKGGTSYAGWACKRQDLEKVERWVRNRGDMKRVRVLNGSWKPRGVGHTHVYVVEDSHPSLAN